MFCEDVGLAEIYNERPWLFICADGCEVGCRQGRIDLVSMGGKCPPWLAEKVEILV